MADIFGTKNSKATQAVIDAASKILMGVNDEETAKAQTEDEHPAVVHAEGMSSKEKMKKGLYNSMDPVGKEDGDVDNDGDKDSSDEYLMKRRKAIKKAMAKESLELPDYVIEAIEEVLALDEDYEVELEEAADSIGKSGGDHVYFTDTSEQGRSSRHSSGVKHSDSGQDQMHFKFKSHKIDVNDAAATGKKLKMSHVQQRVKAAGVPSEHHATVSKHIYNHMAESVDLDASSADKALQHDCAKHVVHKEHGEGQCVPGMHTLEENEDGTGYVTHYDVMFEHGIVENVPVEELEIVSEMSHGHPRKKK